MAQTSDANQVRHTRETILIADDISSVRLLYTTVLKDLGFNIKTAKDGLEAVNKLKSLQPRLAILDIGMHKLDGLKILKLAPKLAPKTRFIVITAHKDRETVLEASRRGIVSYLAKPINLNDLRERVLAAIKQSNAQDSSRTQ